MQPLAWMVLLRPLSRLVRLRFLVMKLFVSWVKVAWVSFTKPGQIALNRTVALKVLKPAVASEPEFRERFLRESAAAAKVAHPNVVQIFDAGEAAGHLFMTFQKIDGGDLADLIKAKGSISEYKSLSIMKECLLGLQAIGQAGLVHRDIKPSNIFMEQGRRPIIGDLGLARQASGDDRMTMTGAAMGTPSYMSPEHIQGVSDIDIRTDLYALGSTLYKMVTGEEPSRGNGLCHNPQYYFAADSRSA